MLEETCISLIGAYSLLGAGSTLVPGKRCSVLPETLPFSILRSPKQLYSN